MRPRNWSIASVVFYLTLAAGTALGDDTPVLFSSTTVCLPPQQLVWEPVPAATSYRVRIEPIPITCFQLMDRDLPQVRVFATHSPALVLDDSLTTIEGQPMAWSDEALWPAARYRWHLETIDGAGEVQEVASGEFFKGIIERYGPARWRHPPLLFVHGFTGTTPRPGGDKALTGDLPPARNDKPSTGRTSSLTYFSDPSTTDGRECWAVGYPNMDSVANAAAVLHAALAVIRDHGTFPWWQARRLDAICGSMGALVMRYALEKLPPVEGIQVDRIVFVGGPHRGTNAAVLQALLFEVISAVTDRSLEPPPAVTEMTPAKLSKVLPVPRRWPRRWMAVVGYGMRLPEMEVQWHDPRFIRRFAEEHNERAAALNRLYYLLDDDGDGLVACASAELGNGRNIRIKRFHTFLELANWRHPERGEERRMVTAVKSFLR